MVYPDIANLLNPESGSYTTNVNSLAGETEATGLRSEQPLASCSSKDATVLESVPGALDVGAEQKQAILNFMASRLLPPAIDNAIQGLVAGKSNGQNVPSPIPTFARGSSQFTLSSGSANARPRIVKPPDPVAADVEFSEYIDSLINSEASDNIYIGSRGRPFVITPPPPDPTRSPTRPSRGCQDGRAKSLKSATRHHPYPTASHHHKPMQPLTPGPANNHALSQPEPSHSVSVANVHADTPQMILGPVPGPSQDALLYPSPAPDRQVHESLLLTALTMRLQRWCYQQPTGWPGGLLITCITAITVIRLKSKLLLGFPVSNGQIRCESLTSRKGKKRATKQGGIPIPIFVDNSNQQRCPMALLQSNRVLCARCKKGCIGDDGFKQHLEEDMVCRTWYDCVLLYNPQIV